MQLILTFAPPDDDETSIEPAELRRVATYLCRWGVPALPQQQAEEAAMAIGRRARFSHLSEWAIHRLLRTDGDATGDGEDLFRELQLHLTGMEAPSLVRSAAEPLAPL